MCANYTNSVLSNCTIVANFCFQSSGWSFSGHVEQLYHHRQLGLRRISRRRRNFYSILNHCLVTSNYSAAGVGGIYGNSGTTIRLWRGSGYFGKFLHVCGQRLRGRLGRRTHN